MEFTTNTKSFFIKCQRVWHILKKPTMEEFWTVAKISALGIFIIGMLGFIIAIIVHIFA